MYGCALTLLNTYVESDAINRDNNPGVNVGQGGRVDIVRCYLGMFLVLSSNI